MGGADGSASGGLDGDGRGSGGSRQPVIASSRLSCIAPSHR
ncbi:hypothetical protein K353_02159 [Kitasatospora sp. SolWspMP-SS2h]|nr:hypothetical protein K353_02159 [Kitasatospora sp. SolWspMP-SS2h]